MTDFPSYELVQRFMHEAGFAIADPDDEIGFPGVKFMKLASRLIQYGSDQELEACCEVLARELICDGKHVATDLHMIRRPKPLSLKEEALKGFDTIADIVLDEYSGTKFYEKYKKIADTIIRALEALPE
jgi:hypothetical protein